MKHVMRHDLKDRRFSCLVVVSLFSHAITTRRDTYWNCICDCGEKHLANTNDLLRGHVKSCGCALMNGIIASAKVRFLGDGVASFNSLFKNYKGSAWARMIPFRLTAEQCKVLFKQDCFYCEIPPMQEHKAKGTMTPFIYNGIDRLDHSKGYIISNCVACCKTCNYAKRDMTLEQFIEYIARFNVQRIVERIRTRRKAA